MKPKAWIEKGKRFEKLIASEIEAEGFGLARREVGSGSGKRKGDIACNLPFLIEAKNQPSVKITAMLKWIDQAKHQAEIGNWDLRKWALVFRDRRIPEANPEIYAVIDFWEFLHLLKKDKEPIIKEPDKEMKWLLQKAVDILKQIIKRLE